MLTQRLNGRYRPSDMRALLAESFPSVGSRFTHFGNIHQPFFYTAKDTIVFPPVSDREDSSNLTSISTALKKSIHLLRDTQYVGKKILFPVVEEQGLFGSYFPRNHFVTLHYDPSTQTATLIDSRPSRYSFWYSSKPMKQSLTNGLHELGLVVQHFNVEHQAVQYDDTYCGAWTWVNIEALANGISIEEHLTVLSAEDKEGIIRHNQDKLNLNKKGVYHPLRQLNKKDSTDTLSTQSSASTESDTVDDCEWDDGSDSMSIASVNIDPIITKERVSPQINLLSLQSTDGVEEEDDCESDEDESDSLSTVSFNVDSIIMNESSSPQINLLSLQSMDGVEEEDDYERDDDESDSLSTVSFNVDSIIMNERASPQINLLALQSTDGVEEEKDSVEEFFLQPALIPEDVDADLQQERITPNFLMQVMCSAEMQTAAVVLLTAGVLAVCLSVTAFVVSPVAASLSVMGLNEATVLAIGATGAALGASILAAGFFMKKPSLNHLGADAANATYANSSL